MRLILARLPQVWRDEIIPVAYSRDIHDRTSKARSGKEAHRCGIFSEDAATRQRFPVEVGSLLFSGTSDANIAYIDPPPPLYGNVRVVSRMGNSAKGHHDQSGAHNNSSCSFEHLFSSGVTVQTFSAYFDAT